MIVKRPKGVLDPTIEVMRPVMARGPQNFDGNLTHNPKVWYFLCVDRLLPGDYRELVQSDSLSWFICPVPGVG